MNELQRKRFVASHPYLADFDLPLSTDRKVPLHQQSNQESTTIALCHLLGEKYHLLNVEERCRSILPKNTISFNELEALIHPKDLKVFTESRAIGLKYGLGRSAAQLNSLALVFDCRMRDGNGHYHLVMFAYKMMGYEGHDDRGEIVLHLKYISGCYEKRASDGCAIVDTSTKKILANGGFCRITKREREVLTLVAEGIPSKHIAHRLGITERTIEKHREKIMRKTRLGNLVCAYIFLQAAGLI